MNRQIEKHEQVMGSEGVIPVSIMHGWRMNLATPTNGNGANEMTSMTNWGQRILPDNLQNILKLLKRRANI